MMRADFKQPYVWLATWFGCGLMKPAPGTWGTIGALPFGIIMLVLGGWQLLLAATIVIFMVGYWATDRYEKATGTHDAKEIVIDEVAGMWLTMTAAGTNPLYLLLAFLLFRCFDIVKRGPVGWCDKRLSGALGVMADDIVAGLLAALCLGGLHYVGFGLG